MFLIGVSAISSISPSAPRPALPPWDGALFKRVWLPSRGLAGASTDTNRAFTSWLFKHDMGLST